jgi:hypothetical protein
MGKHNGIVSGLAAFFGLTVVVGVLALMKTEGRLVYTLDDAYIHMSIARNIVEHRVWGLTQHEIASASSSVLWSLLLALGFVVSGINVWVPLALGLAFGTALIIYLARALGDAGVAPGRCRVLFPLIIVLGYVVPNVFSGMEHTAQSLVDVAFVLAGVNVLAGGRPSFRGAWPLIVLAPFLTSVRYEGFFILAVVCVLLTFRGGLRPAVLVCAMGVLPVAIFGLIMMHKGFRFFPYSVLLKAKTEIPFTAGFLNMLGPRLLIMSLGAPQLVTLLIGLGITLRHLIRHGAAFWSRAVLLHVITISVILLHLEFASTWALFRYDAYLVIMALFTLAVTAGPLFRPGLEIVPERRKLAWVVLSVPVARGFICLLLTPLAAGNIYQQQVQMARFLQRYYPEQPVALNDIGAVSFFSDASIVDLFGLGSKEVAEAKINKRYTTEVIDRVTREKDVTLAMVYKGWFKRYGGLPPEWVELGGWRIPWNVTCFNSTVNIYAVAPNEQEHIMRQLEEFSTGLPRGVRFLCQQGARKASAPPAPPLDRTPKTALGAVVTKRR